MIKGLEPPTHIHTTHTHTHTHSVQSFFGLGQSAEIDIHLLEVEKRKKVDVKNEEGKKEKLPLYFDGETVSGKVSHSTPCTPLHPPLLAHTHSLLIPTISHLLTPRTPFLLPTPSTLPSSRPSPSSHPPFLPPLPSSQVQINLKGKKLEHHGIRVEFIGQIEMFYDRGNHHDFLSLVRQLDPPGGALCHN